MRHAARLENASWEGNGLPFAFDPRLTLLLIAPEDRKNDLAAMARGADYRLLDMVTCDAARARLNPIVGVDVLLIDLRALKPGDRRLDALMDDLLAWPSLQDTRLLTIVDPETLDSVAARLPCDFDQLLCAPRASDIGLALCVLARERNGARRQAAVRRSDEAGLRWFL